MISEKSAKVTILTCIGLFLALQLWPVNRQPEREQGLVEAPEDVLRILERSCFDCHSNRTRWPWYGYVAPFSWLVADHIKEGREALNFATWDLYDEEEQLELREEAWDEVDLGEMPPDYYLLLHPEGRLDESERALLRAWAEGGDL